MIEPAATKLPIVGVMGSGGDPSPELARPLGKLLAEEGYHLLTGGGGGVMAEVSRAYCEVQPRKGFCIGVIRGSTNPDRDGTGRIHYAPGAVNRWVEIPLFTHLPLSGRQGMDEMSRNHINVLTPHALVALPGGAGTLCEVRLRVAYGRAVIFYLGGKTIDGKGAESLTRLLSRDGEVHSADSLEDVRRMIARALDAMES